MHDVCMVKLSAQLPQPVPPRMTRTDKVIQQEELSKYEEGQKTLALYESAKEKMEGATYDDYEIRYTSLDPKVKGYFTPPSEIKSTTEYQQYQNNKFDAIKIKYLTDKASKIDRGKPFVMWEESDANINLVNAYRKGIGTGTLQERRARFLHQRYPTLSSGQISGYVSQETIMDFGVPRTQYGMDIGEKRVITTRATDTGKLLKRETFEKKPSGFVRDIETGAYKIDPKTQKVVVLPPHIQKTTYDPQKAYEQALKKYPIEDKIIKVTTMKIDDRKWYEKSIEELAISPIRKKTKEGFSAIGSGISKFFQVADEYIHWDIKPHISPIGVGGISLVSFGKKEEETDFEEKIILAQEKLIKQRGGIEQVEIERQLGSEFYEQFKVEKEGEAQKKVSSLFLRSEVGKEVFFKEDSTQRDFDVAFKEYTKTPEFKGYEKQYGEGYQKELNKLLMDVPYSEKLKGTWTGFKMVGLGLGSVGLDILKSPTKTAVAVGGIYGAGKLVSAIPTSTLVTLDIAFATGGAGKVLSPASTIEERGVGALMFGVSTTSLGIKGIKYLRQPTIKAIKITPPKATLKTYALGRETNLIRKITSMGKQATIETVKFGRQKLSQTAITGRRTIISTKVRDILHIKPIYQGVPTMQKGTTYALKGIRGTTIYTTPSQYQKALKLLIKRGGLSSAQAKATLRYYSPKVIDVTLEKGELAIIKTSEGQYAMGRYEYLTEQPKLIVNKVLGIKTRGAKAIRDVYGVERKVLGQIRGYDVIGENVRKTTMFAKKGGGSYNLLKQAGKTTTKAKQISFAKVDDPTKSYLKVLLKDKGIGISVTKKLPYTYQDVRSAYIQKQFVPFKRKIDFGTARTSIIKRTGQRIVDLDFDEMAGLDVRKQYGIAPAKIIKTPFSKTFGVDKVKDIIKHDLISTQTAQQLVPTTTATTTTTASLKSAIDPIVQVKQQIRGIVAIDQATKSALLTSGVSVSASALALKTLLKQDTLLKSDVSLKTLLRADLGLKTIQKQSPALKTSQIVSQALASAQLSPKQLSAISGYVLPPMPKPSLKPITPIPFKFDLSLERLMKKKRKKGQKIQELLYLPDFTARVIGLKAEILTQQQAQKRLKKLMTGFEIRKPVKIKY